MDFQFEKYQGSGNDFIILDDRRENFPHKDHNLIQNLCDRHYGIGAEGLIILRYSLSKHNPYSAAGHFFNILTYF